MGLRRCLETCACLLMAIAATTVIAPGCGKSSSTGGGGAGGGTTAGQGGFGGSTEDCDNQETTCGDSTSGCIACAEAFACVKQLNTCNGSLQCREYGQCIEKCAQGDDACTSDCAFHFPNGSSDYDQLLDCVICQHCPVQCDAASAGCGL